MGKLTMKRLGAVLAIGLGALYLINPTAGVIELLPDAIPGIGNLDEAGATAMVIWGLQALRQRAAALPGTTPPPQPDRTR